LMLISIIDSFICQSFIKGRSPAQEQVVL
jgi:hypothetical protein